jgi:uncharacterized protein (DUF2461 family)
MATIEILGWKENFVGFTAWDAHAKSELKRRLRQGIKASPSEIRRLAHQINDRQPVSLQHVHDEAVYSLTQILETTGADFRVSLANSNSEQLLKNCPQR